MTVAQAIEILKTMPADQLLLAWPGDPESMSPQEVQVIELCTPGVFIGTQTLG
jgi:uncharacterized protein YqjF (DUF2071 family)